MNDDLNSRSKTKPLWLEMLCALAVGSVIAGCVLFLRNTAGHKSSQTSSLVVQPVSQEMNARSEKPISAACFLHNTSSQDVNIKIVLGICGCSLHFDGSRLLHAHETRRLDVEIQPLQGKTVSKHLSFLTDEPGVTPSAADIHVRMPESAKVAAKA